MRHLRVTVFALCAFGLVPTGAFATDAVSDRSSVDESATYYGERWDDDPASAMRLRTQSVFDGHSQGEKRARLIPCEIGRSKNLRFICWSSYGRNLQMALPKLVFGVVHTLRPRTLYSYKALDVRMPPSLRMHLPFNATTDVGYDYDDDILGVRVGLRF